MAVRTLHADAEPYHASGGPLGILLCHGFTGSPQSLRPWAEHHAAAGLTVSIPRLPGHGTDVSQMSRTRWEDWYAEVERALDDLTRECDDVFVGGLSMGGTLALRMAELHPTQVGGLVLVNPSVHGEHPALALLPLLRYVIPFLRGPLGDIRKPGVAEVGYDRMPLQALYSLTRLWKITAADLPRVQAPVLMFRSAEDHVVEPASGRMLAERISSAFEERILPNSYHVATLDNDAQTIFDGSLEFIRNCLATSRPTAATPGTRGQTAVRHGSES